MKLNLSFVFCLLVALPNAAMAEQSVVSPQPVSVSSGKVALTPENTQINFVGAHEGPKPDPRKGGFTKFVGNAAVGQSGAVESIGFEIETGSLWTEFPKLTGHLKSPDFFDVRQHPKASFESTAIATKGQTGSYEITGSFTLLGKKQEIKIPAAIMVTEDGITLVSQFTLDRTEFGMTYGVGKVKKEVDISVQVGMPTTAKAN